MLNYQSMKSDSFLGLHGTRSHAVNQRLIEPLVTSFFQTHGVEKYFALKADLSISDKDFKGVDFSYYYNVVMSRIVKNNRVVDFETAYIITIDEKNCSLNCEHTGMKYDVIKMNDKPILYFIYVPVELILDFLRKGE